MTIVEALERFEREQVARGLSSATRRGYRCLLRQMAVRAEADGLADLNQVDREWLRGWRDSWTVALSTHRLRMSRLAHFFRVAASEDWIGASPMQGMRAPKVRQSAVEPLETWEMRKLLQAAKDGSRVRALLLLMRYSGLAIQDAVCAPCSALMPDGCLILRRAKNGNLVIAPLPGVVSDVLAAIELAEARKHWFWTGRGQRATAAKLWRRKLHSVAEKAGVAGFHPHRLRHTFAVSMLASGVPMGDVSILLGHSSVKTTERHYAAWDPSRRDRLRRIVNKALDSDPLLGHIRGSRECAEKERRDGALNLRPANRLT